MQNQPAQIRQALNSSARYLTGRFQAYEQGNGLLNVGAAWDLLKTNIKTVEIIVVGAGQHGAERLPGDARRRRRASTTARA